MNQATTPTTTAPAVSQRLHAPFQASANARTRIKICGLTREEDVDAAVAAGADAVGFVLYAPSPRSVTPQRAAQLARRLPPFVTPVLLFVNESTPNIIAASAMIAGATVQFHGDETPQDCMAATHQGARPYLRAARIPLGDGAAQFDLVKYAHDYSHAQAILLDAHVEGFGGSGKAFNWSLLPPSVSSHLVLSGGLTPANVTDGILQVRPRGLSLAVDVSSGVEADGPDGKPVKGIKDAVKIQRFVAAVRAADAQLAKNPHEFLSAT
ncbi:phosphoribosylanthranilate isomerase [Acidovorax sp. ACV02]|uniref:phosphoribosylanthranilate isomerase n=1 Tax=Acidovorax sp. ACV02 TaxID=2769310 RepID=UPI0017845DBD|nr:phosphoribosylanthranilate isomerase [Acidovorax sp. ACV02]MBD9404226.1 phosphoribosylanthranilate isomerase [Acidovorax sp. ACV02]